MSIIIQFNSPSYIQSAGVPSPCHSKKVKLEMVPGIERSDIPIMTDDDGSIIDITKNGVFATTFKDVRTSHYCFGLPYQDHNYGAPPPPTPPSYSPCPSPAAVVAIANEDSNHSVASTTTEEAPEESITRCICGFEHDDEYMICCDNCLVWQHIDCMDLDRNNIPETYLCEKCEPRKLDRHKAKLLQARKKSVLTKLPPSKQELNANNLVFGKNYKKKSLLHSPEQWQHVNTSSQPQRFYGSTDSDEETKNNDLRPKTRSKRRKREQEKDLPSKRSKSMTKNGRERMEMKRSRLRRSKNKESTSTADEEAQDAWAYSTEWCEENFEAAVTNQYTPEVQHLARMMRPLGHEKKFFDQLQSKQCHIIDDGKKKQLVSLYDIPRNQPLIEYKGKYLLASQFHDLHPLYNKRLYPYIMFYTVDQTEICVDSSMYGNDARFVRRSCKPNAEIRHMSYNGNLHLFLQSSKVIFSEDEITVPLNFNQCDSIKDVVCSCASEDCFLRPRKRNGSVEVYQEKRRRTRRSTISAEDESSQSVLAITLPEKIKTSPEKMKTSPEKVKASPEKMKASPEKFKASPEKMKMSPEKMKASPVKNEIPELPVSHVEINEPVIDTKALSDHESEEPSAEDKKKMTREQRKIEAYMRAFNQMEKAQRRKQQALQRQKSHPSKTEESSEKSECTENVAVKEEEKPPPEPEAPPEKEEIVEEEVKVQPPTPLKPKKGKRRRGSGTPSRRRTRTNSGGSEILPTLEEIKQVLIEPEPTVEPPAPIPEPVNEPMIVIPCPVLAPSSPSPSSAEESPKALKTKRLLLQEWLLEKSEEATSVPSTPASSSPRTIHTELKWNTTAASATCYVRCTKDTPHSGGISAAHLRRSNSSGHLRAAGGQGSAKKRWLRQAMHDCPEEPLGMDLSIMEHLEGSCLSPSCHGDVDSLGGGADDIITPLKKRRLMRESIESLSSPHSPSLENGMDDTDATTSSLTNDTQIDQKIDTIDQHHLCATNEDSMQLSPKEEDISTWKEIDKPEFEKAEECQVKYEIVGNESTLDAISTKVDCNNGNIDTKEIEPSKVEEAKPCRTEEVKPCTTEEVKPCKTEEVKSSNTEEVKPCKTEEIKLCETEVEPCQAEEVQPCKTEDVKPCQTEEVKPCQTEEVKPCQTEEVKPCQTKDVKPCQTKDVKPCQTEDVKPCQAEDVKPCKTEVVKPCQTEEIQPCLTETDQPCKAEEAKLCKAEEAKLCKAEEAKLCKAEEAKLCKAEEAKPCKTEEAKLCKAEEAKLCKAEEAKPCKTEIKPRKTEEIEPFKTEETSMQTDCQVGKRTTSLTMPTNCGLGPVVNGNMCDETINNSSNPILMQGSDIKTISLNQVLPDPELNSNSACHMNSPRVLENVPLNSEVKPLPDVAIDNISSVNQSVKAIKAEITDNENTLAQKQALNFCAAPITLSPVHKISPIEIKCTSPITHDLKPITEVESPEKESIKHLSLVGHSGNHTCNIKLPMQELSDPSLTNETNPYEGHVSSASKDKQAVNSKDHSINNRAPDLSVQFEKMVCSKDSSYSNIAGSNSVDSCFIQTKQSIDFSTDILIKANGVKDTQVRIQCIPEEDISPVKACASATQKRKVSLSEYRMRMRENSGKSRTNSDIAKNSVDGMCTALEKLPAQVTLAPLPLFNVGDSSKEQNKQSAAKKKKDTTLNEEDSKEAEHRENLNERLKREFGFDVSEDSASFLQTKSKCNNQSLSEPPPMISNLPLDPQSLPPPPPPPPPRGVPRPLRAPHPVIGGVPAPISAPPYGYVHPPYTRPPYIIPQVPGAPYIPPQPPLLPPIHQLPPNGSAPCNLRAPLLPSTHSFAPSMPGTLMRTPTRHAPANAQRFSPQPRPPHKAFPHVYQSGLYK